MRGFDQFIQLPASSSPKKNILRSQ